MIGEQEGALLAAAIVALSGTLNGIYCLLTGVLAAAWLGIAVWANKAAALEARAPTSTGS